jgi:hypothetical protein
MPKDQWGKAKRGDIARRETARQGFEQRERQLDNAKRKRSKPYAAKTHASKEASKSIDYALHPKAEQIAAAEHRVDMLDVFYDCDILAKLEAASRGSANAFYEALVMMRRKIG